MKEKDIEERVMDSMQLEKERGITIMAKWTSLLWKDYTLNIVDTPGHADFGSEVERIVSMVDGVCLLVDATDGPMTQTKFVLQKALQAGLKPLVVINKVDRDTARIGGEVENEIFDLFVSLDATDDQLDYPVLYASAKQGWAVRNFKDDKRENVDPLFQAIVDFVPVPKVEQEPFKLLATNLEYDRHFGKILTGKIYSGQVKNGDKLKAISRTGELIEEARVYQLMSRVGISRVNVAEAFAGDIVSVCGFLKAGVTDTICDPAIKTNIPSRPLDPPIMSVVFFSNDSPLAGKEGEHCSAIKLRARLVKEGENNVGLTIKPAEEGDAMEVMARGEMQLAILIEQMRREGYEFQVSTPLVLFKKDEKGKDLEPIEECIIDCDANDAGMVMEKMSKRKGEMKDYKVVADRAKFVYHCPTRLLIGFASEFKTETRGSGVYNHTFLEYGEYRGPAEKVRKGVMISMARGNSTAYALNSLEDRGQMFIGAQVPIYEGMIVGESARSDEIECNPCKEKHLTNVRSVQKEDAIKLAPARRMQLEEALSYIQADELLEVTPVSIRMRKRTLNSTERKKQKRTDKNL